MDAPTRGPGRPKDLTKRAAILDAAKTMFLEQGVAGVSMQEVADRAGVSKLTLYSHFGDKAGLFLAAVQSHYSSIVRSDLFQAWEGDIGDDLLRFAHAYRQSIVKPESMGGRRLLWQPDLQPELVAQVWEAAPLRIEEQLRDLLAQASARGALAIPDAMVAAHMLLGLLQGDLRGPLLYAIPMSADTPDVRYAEHVVALFMRAFAPPAESLVTNGT